MRILFYKQKELLGGTGGVEKVLSNLLNAFDASGHEVYLATRDPKDAPLFFPLGPHVSFRRLIFSFPKLYRFLGRDLRLGRYIKRLSREVVVSRLIRSYCDEIRPDIIVATGIADFADIAFENPFPCPTIVMVHSWPSVYFSGKNHRLLEKTIQKASCVQVLFPAYILPMRKYYSGPIVAIGNGIALPDVNLNIQKRKIILCLGRFSPEKNQLSLIRAFAQIATAFPDWELHFWGNIASDYYSSCLNKTKELHLDKSIHFKGLTHEVASLMREAEVFALPSIFEGFPLALGEAMLSSLPCIGFRDCTGVNQLISDGENGFLANDENDFARKLAILLGDQDLRKSLGKVAAETISQFSVSSVVSKWQSLFANYQQKE